MILFFVMIAVIFIILAAKDLSGNPPEPPERKCGRLGEEHASKMIKSILNGNYRLLSNITVSFQQKTAELDNVGAMNPAFLLLKLRIITDGSPALLTITNGKNTILPTPETLMSKR